MELSKDEVKKRLSDLWNAKRLHAEARERVKILEEENKKLKEKVKGLEKENKLLKRKLEGVDFELEQLKIKPKNQSWEKKLKNMFAFFQLRADFPIVKYRIT